MNALIHDSTLWVLLLLTLTAIFAISSRKPERQASRSTVRDEPKPKYWRITGITGNHSGKSIEQKLKSGLEDACNFDIKIVRRTKRDFCAIVTSLVPPSIHGTDWALDERFVGISPLSAPENAKFEYVDLNLSRLTQVLLFE
jgi:hypothetical protein